MALVVFLRGVNVGGHRRFRPSLLATQLERYDVVNIGAAGTFVVRNAGSRSAFEAALRSALPFDTHVMICDARDLLCAHAEHPYDARPPRAGVVRFVSVRSKASRLQPSLPVQLPHAGRWLVRVLAVEGQFVFGEYRRHMKTIGYLGQLDKLVGGPVTTRNWNTIATIVALLAQPNSAPTLRASTLRTSRSERAPRGSTDRA
ncbi:MAG TPA: DUF1697 domain-containing protein [Gemmatimonadaceae bacterium]|jgi:uncharacterized protein (DUF1697 family)|nr:DUF1697 domain-containing protein [Gemmatimonadaceae bacterium]